MKENSRGRREGMKRMKGVRRRRWIYMVDAKIGFFHNSPRENVLTIEFRHNFDRETWIHY